MRTIFSPLVLVLVLTALLFLFVVSEVCCGCFNFTDFRFHRIYRLQQIQIQLRLQVLPQLRTHQQKCQRLIYQPLHLQHQLSLLQKSQQLLLLLIRLQFQPSFQHGDLLSL